MVNLFIIVEYEVFPMVT